MKFVTYWNALAAFFAKPRLYAIDSTALITSCLHSFTVQPCSARKLTRLKQLVKNKNENYLKCQFFLKCRYFFSLADSYDFTHRGKDFPAQKRFET